MGTLSDMMDFDHVIRVRRDGAITDAENIYAPELIQSRNDDDTWTESLEDEDWELLDGFSGQSGYSGPMMHSSEYIGGAMARHIRANPGFYVAIYPTVIDDLDPDAVADSWAVAFCEDTDPTGAEMGRRAPGPSAPMFEVIAEGYVTVADEDDPTPAQCSWGAGGDPASGCDNLAGSGDVCEHHEQVAHTLGLIEDAQLAREGKCIECGTVILRGEDGTDWCECLQDTGDAGPILAAHGIRARDLTFPGEA